MNFLTHKTEHYVFNYFPNSLAAENIQRISEIQENAYREILLYLNIKNNKVINYFLYPDNKTKGELMGDDGNGNTIFDKFEVHAVYNEEIKCIGAHEDTHLLSRPLGKSVILFSEGLAEFMSKLWNGKEHDYWVKKFISDDTMPPITEIIDVNLWDNYDDKITYPCAGSFVNHLIQKIGKDRFLDIYTNLSKVASREDNMAIFQDIAKISLSDFENEWKENILLAR